MAEDEMNAWNDLTVLLADGESVQAVVFGAWGWGRGPEDEKEWTAGYSEPDPPLIPFDWRGKVFGPDDARRLMAGWSFNGGHGAPECYATYIWTDRRVFWVTQYDGATRLDCAPRNPVDCIPDMPGG